MRTLGERIAALDLSQRAIELQPNNTILAVFWEDFIAKNVHIIAECRRGGEYHLVALTALFKINIYVLSYNGEASGFLAASRRAIAQTASSKLFR